MKNRIFKFRVWSTKENKWMFGYEYPNLGGFSLVGEVMLLGEWGAYPLERYFDDFVIMQFTGLCDINKKEIYENDIVKGCTFNGSYALGKVVYYEDSFIVVPIGKFLEGVDSITCDSIEVVGNVFQNKELLK